MKRPWNMTEEEFARYLDRISRIRTPDAARVLGVSVRQMQTWRKKGGGPKHTRSADGVIHYKPEALEAFIGRRQAGDSP